MFKDFIYVFLTLFAIIDVIGSIPIFIYLKSKNSAKLRHFQASFWAGVIMVTFFLVGDHLLTLLGVDQNSFSVAGAIIIFFIGLEMILGIEFFKSENTSPKNDFTIFPVAFPILSGAGVLTTIISLKPTYNAMVIISAIIANLVIIYFTLVSTNKIKKTLGNNGIIALRKFFGIILIAIAVKMFIHNINILIKTL